MILTPDSWQTRHWRFSLWHLADATDSVWSTLFQRCALHRSQLKVMVWLSFRPMESPFTQSTSTPSSRFQVRSLIIYGPLKRRSINLKNNRRAKTLREIFFHGTVNFTFVRNDLSLIHWLSPVFKTRGKSAKPWKKKESKSFPNQLKNALDANYEIQSQARTAEKIPKRHGREGESLRCGAFKRISLCFLINKMAYCLHHCPSIDY